MTLRILHLEDNRDDVELVRMCLRRHGLTCEVEPVSSGPAYLAALESRRFDLILSDSGLPGYGGEEALAAARARCPDVPFVVLSGYPAVHEPGATAGTGIAAQLSKIDLEQLGPIIERVLARAPGATLDVAKDPQTPPAAASAAPALTELALMEHLVTVVQRLSLARTLDSITAIVRRAARELTGADGATFVLRDQDRSYHVDEDGISRLWKGQRLPMSACISGWVMLNRQAAVIEDIYRDARIHPETYRPTFVKSLVVVPIRQAEPLGAIGTYWAQVRRPTLQQVRLLQALAYSTSVALESIDLLADLERRLAQRTAELARKAAELESVSRELESFSYAVAHDLRAPLISIDGFTHMLREASAVALDEQAQECLQRISNAAHRMNGLIKDLHGLSKIGRASVHRSHTDLSALARELAATVRARSGRPAAELAIADALYADCDAGMARIVLENLLSNAWKFTSKRTDARIEFGARTEADGSRTFFVRDNGAGFNPRHAAKLFAPFQRLHLQEDFPGTGIGLATVQRIIHRHGGAIWAESQPGEGATFYFTLPSDP